MDVTLRTATRPAMRRPTPVLTPARRPHAPLTAVPRGRPPGIAGRWAAWAARIGGRRTAWIGSGPLVPRAWWRPAFHYRQPPAPAGAALPSHPTGAWPLHLTLRVTVPAVRTVVTAAAAPLTRAAAGAALAMPARMPRVLPATRAVLPAAPVQRIEMLTARLRRREVWTAEREARLVQRVLTRYHGVEVTDPAPAPPTRAVTLGPAVWMAAPLPRVVSRPFVIPAIVPAPPPEPAPPPPALRYWDGAPTPPPAWPAPEIERLTDQVIRTIDERVVAARERLGRG